MDIDISGWDGYLWKIRGGEHEYIIFCKSMWFCYYIPYHCPAAVEGGFDVSPGVAVGKLIPSPPLQTQHQITTT